MNPAKKQHPELSLLESTMVPIPAGAITMRDDRINKVWEVRIDAFHMSRFPVTQRVYKSIVKANPSTFIGDDLPVESITWLDAVSFCNALSHQMDLLPYYNMDDGTELISINNNSGGFRLPSEAEWQYACQAGESGARYGEIQDIAWYKENSDGRTQIVGRKQPNTWGLYDMLGNVWEWCSDIYDEKVYGSYRVFRGGGWSDEERSVLATNRRRSHPASFKIDDLGFRIARTKHRID